MTFLIFLASAVGDATLGQIVRRQFYGHLVTCKNTYVIFTHFAGNVRRNHVPVFKFYAEHGIRQSVDHFAFHFYLVFFRHEFFAATLKSDAFCLIRE